MPRWWARIEGGQVWAVGLGDPPAVGSASTAGGHDAASVAVASALADQMDEWLHGQRRDFDLPLRWEQVTPFAASVYRAADSIGVGSTATYGEVARRLGRRGAARAVGQALAANPWLVVVPCHRVVPASGSLGGYAGGAPAKQWLLDHERWLVAGVGQASP